MRRWTFGGGQEHPAPRRQPPHRTNRRRGIPGRVIHERDGPSSAQAACGDGFPAPRALRSLRRGRDPLRGAPGRKGLRRGAVAGDGGAGSSLREKGPADPLRWATAAGLDSAGPGPGAGGIAYGRADERPGRGGASQDRRPHPGVERSSGVHDSPGEPRPGPGRARRGPRDPARQGPARG